MLGQAEDDVSQASIPAQDTGGRSTCVLESAMLCKLCDDITLRISTWNSDSAEGEIESRIRTYDNIYALRNSSVSCNFCGLLYEEAKSLENGRSGPYCKEIWGMELTEYLLATSPIDVHHVSLAGRHNVALSCLLDAQNAPGYISGPAGYQYEARLGGIYVNTGKMDGWTVQSWLLMSLIIPLSLDVCKFRSRTAFQRRYYKAQDALSCEDMARCM